jgi:hypothetical protein
VWQNAHAIEFGFFPLATMSGIGPCSAGNQSGALKVSPMRAAVNFCALSGMPSGSMSSSLGGGVAGAFLSEGG